MLENGADKDSSQRSSEFSHLQPSEYESIRHFLEDSCGLILGPSKQYLVKSRLNKVIKNHQFKSYADLIKHVHSDSTVRFDVIDAMTTHETFWFRDVHPFDYLKKTVFPTLSSVSSSGVIRIWCAACSSGQEPYTISMVTEEARLTGLLPKNWEVEILATDISPAIIGTASKGEYEGLAVDRGLTAERKQKFFDQHDQLWKVKDHIRKRVDFKTFNLHQNYRGLGTFDIIMCRNVLIYFSAEKKQEILERIHSVMAPHRFLFLGASEALNGLPHFFKLNRYNPGIVYIAR
ncbi:MAG: protein-glutamate O-methyltransferase CheR [Pseudomonadota bacterium]